jgi:hypothetical protein
MRRDRTLIIALIVIALAGVGLWGYQHRHKPSATPRLALAQVAANSRAAAACKAMPAPNPSEQDPASLTRSLNLCVGLGGKVAKPLTYMVKSGAMVTLHIHGTDEREDTFVIDDYPDLQGEIDAEDTQLRFLADKPGAHVMRNVSQHTVVGTLVITAP